VGRRGAAGAGLCPHCHGTDIEDGPPTTDQQLRSDGRAPGWAAVSAAPAPRGVTRGRARSFARSDRAGAALTHL